METAKIIFSSAVVTVIVTKLFEYFFLTKKDKKQLQLQTEDTAIKLIESLQKQVNLISDETKQLRIEVNEWRNKYEKLNILYNSLQTEYEALERLYKGLQNKYNTLKRAFDKLKEKEP